MVAWGIKGRQMLEQICIELQPADPKNEDGTLDWLQ